MGTPSLRQKEDNLFSYTVQCLSLYYILPLIIENDLVLFLHFLHHAWDNWARRETTNEFLAIRRNSILFHFFINITFYPPWTNNSAMDKVMRDKLVSLSCLQKWISHFVIGCISGRHRSHIQCTMKSVITSRV